MIADTMHLLRSSIAFYDIENRIFAQSEAVADFAVRLAFSD